MTQVVKASNRRFYFRFVYLSIAVAALAVILIQQLNDTHRHQRLVQEQFELTVRMLTQQAALASSQPILDQNSEALTALVDNLASDPYILDAVIYDAEGVALARSKGALSYQQLGGFGPFKDQTARHDVLFYVSEVELAGEVLGYLRLALERESLLVSTGQLLERELQQGRIMLLLAALAGFTLAAALMRPAGTNAGK